MIRGTKIDLYIRAMKLKGFTKEEVLGNTGVDPKVLTAPDGMVSRDVYAAVILNMIKISGKPDISFWVGGQMQVSDLGILGNAMLSSATLGQLVRIRQQYQCPMFGTMVNIESVRTVGSGFEMTIAPTTGFTETLRRFETEEFLSAGRHLVKQFVGITPVISSVSLSYSKPAYGATYESYFKCPIEFGAPKTVLRFQSPSLDTCISSANPELFQICAQHCEKIVQSVTDSCQLRGRLRNLFLRSPGNLPDLQSAANSLGISERHLRRKLDAEGISYQELKDDFRLDLSRQLLLEGHMAPKEVAYLLGYSAHSAFCRAFKLWTGTTVRQYTTDSCAQLSRGDFKHAGQQVVASM